MSRASFRHAIAMAFLVGAFAARPARAAWPHDPLVNLQIAPNPGTQATRSIVSDGAGGALIVWEDSRKGTESDIYAQHVTASGAVAPGWPASGLGICTASGSQYMPAAVSDGTGGAIIAWVDPRGGNTDIYAMRVNGDGTFPAGWPANGRQLLADPHNEDTPVIVSDGAGGADVAWQYDFGTTDTDIYGARVNASGTVLWAHSLWAPVGFQNVPTAVADGAGGLIVAFQDNQLGTYDIRAVHYNGAGVSIWGGTVDVCTAASDQGAPAGTSDGAGGMIVAWQDSRSGNTNIYAEQITFVGAVATGWPANGYPVCVDPAIQELPRIVPDGAGGAIVSWIDYRDPSGDIYAQRMLAGGSPAFGWPYNGTAICAGTVPSIPAMVADGSGGAIFAWADSRTGVSGDQFASRVTGDGLTPPGWLYNGTPVSLAGGDQISNVIASDGSGGAIVAWMDSRAGTSQAWAQTIDSFGQLGDARPGIASIRDVKADQGGHVRLVWNASYLDAKPRYAVASYWIWRQTPASAAAAAVKDGAAWVDGPGGDAALAVTAGVDVPVRRLFRHAQDATSGFAWEYVVTQPTNGSAQYSYVAPTVSDSLGGYNPYTVFMVEAHGTATGTFWDSPADSGYSVDNLPPFAPAPFTAALTAPGDTHLHWGPNLEADLANYRLYRGSSAGFVPAPSNRIASPTDTGYVDTGSAGSYYKLSAVDIHGNESAFALVSPSGTLDVNDGRALELALAPPAPNPAREPLRIVFALPHATRVRLAIYDVAGRVTRLLADDMLAAGEQARMWDLRDRSGSAVQPGLYFVRMEAGGRRFDERLVVIGPPGH